MALRDILVAFNVTVDQTQLVSAQRNVGRLISQFNALARIAQFAIGMLGVGKLTDAADEYINIENKLKAVTNSTEEFVEAQRGVERIADELAQPVKDITDAYLRYTLATESLGESQENVLDFTKRVTQAMILSGATSEEAHRAAVQLAQGFGKNFKAAAQDLKSVKEQAPVLARIIEKAAGALPGSLLVAAKAGKVTSRLVFDAVREAGEELDRDWVKRQKRFEDISNLLGNQFLRLIKLLKPMFVPIIDVLESIVHWIGEWVKDGSALNAVIAGMITAVGTLTYFMGGLALRAAAAAAPFMAIFFALDELVAFIRGDESFLEDWLVKAFGVEKTEAARKAMQELVTLVKDFFKLLGSDGGPELEMVGWRLKRAVLNGLKTAWDEFVEYAYNSDNPLSRLIKWSTARSGTASEDKTFFQMTPGEFLGGALGRGTKKQLEEEYGAAPGAAPALNPTNPVPVVPPNWEPVGTLPQPMSPYGYSNMTPASPVITTNVTVEGNATPAVAREVADRAGEAAAAALGRDRAAVGAGFGVQP